MLTLRGFIFAALLSVSAFGQIDPPVDKAHPAAMESFQLPSHGAKLNAFVYVAAGAGPHATVILLHGFPGNEKNLDVAQAIRRAGMNVLFFNYRGSWGSPGDFSFTHCVEDAASAVAYLHDRTNAFKLRVDPAKIYLVGHSMGGFVAVEAGAADPTIKGVITISAEDMAARMMNVPADQQAAALKATAASLADEGMAPLAGTSPETLAKETLANAARWSFIGLAPKFTTRPLFVITSDDGLAPMNDAFVEAVKKAGGKDVKSLHIATDHSYSDHRIALEQAVVGELQRMR